MTLILITISIYITLVPLIAGTLRFSQLSSNQHVLFWMIVVISMNQFTSEFLESFLLKITNNLPFYRFYIIVEFGFLSYLFWNILNLGKIRIYFIALVVIFTLFWIIDTSILGSIWVYPEYLRFCEGIIIVLFCAIYFYMVFKRAEVVALTKDFGFWLSAGLIIYFLGNSLLFLFSQFVLSLSDASFYLIWGVHAFLTILLYIAYTIAIRCKTSHNLS